MALVCVPCKIQRCIAHESRSIITMRLNQTFRFISLLPATLLIVPALLLGTSSNGSAHPHVWVDYSLEARFDRNGLTGFQHRWVFDEMFSSQIMEMFDADSDGFFSPEEIEEVRQGAFAYLREHNYFIHIKIDGHDFTVQYVQDFHAAIDGHQVIYEFFVPCTVAAVATPKTIHLLVADMEYFVDMSFLDGGLTIQGREFVDVEHEFASGKAFSFWGGSWTPEYFTLRFHKTS